MSAEVIRYVLENTRRTVFSGIRQLLRAGQNLELIMFLIDSGGVVHMTSWTQANHPSNAMDVITDLCRRHRAVAALFVDEIDGQSEYRVAAVHWCYPDDGVSDSSFFILDPDNADLGQDDGHEIDVPEHLIDWLDEALEFSRVP